MSKTQRTYALAGIVAIALTLVCAKYLIPQYSAYLERVNAEAPVCAIGPPARCIKAREGA